MGDGGGRDLARSKSARAGGGGWGSANQGVRQWCLEQRGGQRERKGGGRGVLAGGEYTSLKFAGLHCRSVRPRLNS